MPDKMYMDWLKSVIREKGKYQNNKVNKIFSEKES
jgi:hypothetical protein